MTYEKYEEELTQLSNNHYEIKDNFLGEGAFGVVYECCNLSNPKKKLVVKIYPIEEKRYAIQELNIFNKLAKHKTEFLNSYTNSNIVELYDYYISNEFIYTIYERADTSLEDFIIEFNKKFKSRPPLFFIVKIIKEILIGLIELNTSNIIHCDLKLDNVFINFKTSKKDFLNLFNQKNLNHQKILDSFTIKLIDLNKSTFINHILKPLSVQTIEFQAPEIVFGNCNYNESIDVWSVGIILWNLITGFELIDMNNMRIEYYPFYKNYNPKAKEIINSSSEESQEESNNEYYDSNDINTIYENNIYLNKLFNIIGECDKSLIIGKDIDKYFKCNKLIGHSCIKYNNCVEEIIMNEKNNFKLQEDEIESKLKYLSDLLSKNILIYNYKNRITPFHLYELLNF